MFSNQRNDFRFLLHNESWEDKPSHLRLLLGHAGMMGFACAGPTSLCEKNFLTVRWQEKISLIGRRWEKFSHIGRSRENFSHLERKLWEMEKNFLTCGEGEKNGRKSGEGEKMGENQEKARESPIRPTAIAKAKWRSRANECVHSFA